MSPIFVIGGIWAAALILSILYFGYRLKAKKQNSPDKKGIIRFTKQETGRNYLYYVYRLFQIVPFLRRQALQVQSRFRILYPADERTVEKETAKAMVKACRWFLLIFAGAAAVSGGDLFFVVFSTCTALAVAKNTITKWLEDLDNRLLVQFSEALSGIIPAYREHHGHLDDAVYSMLDELPPLISLHMSVIYEILSAPDIETRAEQYADYAPNRFLLSFVSLAIPVRVYGDKTLPDGNTAFLKGVMHLKRELNEEIMKRKNIDLAFSSLTVISIGAVCAIKPAEWFFTWFMPQTKNFFRGPVGMTVTAFLFLVSYGCYSMILSLKTSKDQEVKETSFWSKLAAIPQVDAFLNVQMNRHYTRWMRTDKMLRAIRDHTGVKAFMVKSAAYAACAFLGVNILCLGASSQAAANALHGAGEALSGVIVPNETYEAEMEQAADALIQAHKEDTELDPDALAAEVREMSGILRADTYVTPVVEAVTGQIQAYRNVYFRWYYEIFAVLAAVLAFHIPAFFLRFQTRQIQMAKEDEVNSFHLLALIFMDLDGTQISTVLEWMERFSYCFKDAIAECIISLEMGEKKALEKLYEYDDMFEFRKFIKSLMAVDDIGFANAFADIEIQQDYYNEKRQLDNQKLIMQKSVTASRLAFIPMYAVIILELVFPMLYYAASMIRQMSAMLGQM